MERYRWVFEVSGKLHTAGYCVSVWQITLSNKQLLAFSSSLIAIAKNGQSNVPLGEQVKSSQVNLYLNTVKSNQDTS